MENRNVRTTLTLPGELLEATDLLYGKRKLAAATSLLPLPYVVNSRLKNELRLTLLLQQWLMNLLQLIGKRFR
jgi:hypothetical protein